MIATAQSASDAPATTDQRALAERALRIGKRTALGVLRDPEAASDVAQEVAIAALRGARAIRDQPASTPGYTAWRRGRRSVMPAGSGGGRTAEQRRSELVAPDPDPAAGGLPAALHALPPRQRAALTLRYVHDLDDRDIARALGCRASTVQHVAVARPRGVAGGLDHGG